MGSFKDWGKPTPMAEFRYRQEMGLSVEGFFDRKGRNRSKKDKIKVGVFNGGSSAILNTTIKVKRQRQDH